MSMVILHRGIYCKLKKYIPFDFEYFIENGIEFFDSIKYFYSIGKLIKNKKNRETCYYI